MIEFLILFELNKKILTMYGIAKEIHGNFSVLSIPSFGTIKPALKRLESKGFIKSQKTMSDGGRPSVYYSITDNGEDELKRLVTEPPSENPVHFLTVARAKLLCADILDKDSKLKMLDNLKMKAETIVAEINNIMAFKDLSFYPKMVFENLICEYKNFIMLLEEFKNAGSRE